MKRISTNAKWAAHLMRSKNFLLLTDEKSVMCLDGLERGNFEDLLTVTAQANALREFEKNLKTVIKRHDVVLERLTKGILVNTKRKPAMKSVSDMPKLKLAKKSKAKKIVVK